MLTVKGQECQGELDTREKAKEKEVRLSELPQERDTTLNVFRTRQLWPTAIFRRPIAMAICFLLLGFGLLQNCPASLRQRKCKE